MKLNLLRAARTNPKLSAYAHMHGNFDFTSTPMAPPGTKLLIHMHPDKRGSWELHGDPGWYVGLSLNHYRCVQCYVPRTRSIVNSDSVEFFPNKTPFPAVTMKDHLQQSASDLVSMLTNPPSTTVPSLSAGDDIENAILEIAKILKRADVIPNLSAICDAPLPRVAPTMTSKFTPMTTPTTSHAPSAAPPTIIPCDEDEHDAPSPRVGSQAPDPATVEALLNRSSLPKNARFRNSTNHRYPLRSRSNLIQHVHQNPTEENLAAYTFNPTCSANLIYKDDGTKETIDSLLKGPHKSIWEQSLSNEWGRLAQSNNSGVKGTDTIEFIIRKEVPPDKKVTYATMVCDYKPLKDEKHRVRITVGGDRLPCYQDAGSPAADLLETKILLNSVISDARTGARFMCLDVKDHFLATPMTNPEFMRVRVKHIPQDIRIKYDIDNLVTIEGWVHVKIKKGCRDLSKLLS